MSEYIVDFGTSTYKSNDGLIFAPVEQLRGEIVRCRDCKNFEPDGEPSEVYPNSYWCDKLTVYMPPNGFCSWGGRREP